MLGGGLPPEKQERKVPGTTWQQSEGELGCQETRGSRDDPLSPEPFLYPQRGQSQREHQH